MPLEGVLRLALSMHIVMSSICWVLGDLCFLGVVIKWFAIELASVLGVSGMVNSEMGF